MSKSKNHDIWSRFDFRAACLFTGYRNRERGLREELDRVGMSDVHWMWQFPTPLDSILRRSTSGRLGLNPGFFSCGMGHYRAIKTAYELGSSHFLIMEDDIRFLNDVSMVKEIVDDIPDDYDVALLDSFKPQSMTMQEWRDNAQRSKVSKHWCRFYNMRSFACYSMSRRGMERWIRLWESAFMFGGRLHVCDQYMHVGRFGADMNMYHAITNPCIQQDVGGNACSGGVSGIHLQKYRDYGLDIDAYAK